MSTIQFPVAWCDNLGIKAHRVRLPFGLPPFESTDPFALMDQLKVLLAGFTPILQVIDCVTKVITLLKALVGPPPDIPGAIDALKGLAKCASVVLPNFIVPLQIVKFIQFAVDLIQLAIDVIQAIINNFERLAQLRIAENDLLNSLDQALQAQGACVKEANDQIAAGIASKMASVEGLLALINLMLTLAGQDPISIDAGLFVPEGLQDVIDALQSALDALNQIPGVSD